MSPIPYRLEILLLLIVLLRTIYFDGPCWMIFLSSCYLFIYFKMDENEIISVSVMCDCNILYILDIQLHTVSYVEKT